MSDKRYELVNVMIEQNKITTFQEIFHLIPKSRIGKELRINNPRMTNLIYSPFNLTLNEIDKLADLFSCTTDKIIELIRAQDSANCKTRIL
jgi:hypothetical protein